MVGRSRTGCLTCRQRKLKCDEQRPVCGQCHKASRDCIPSSGIVFRHQQNASMNHGADTDDSLQGFYAYKNTFDKDSVWVAIPKRVTFIINADPDLDYDAADSGLLPDTNPSSKPADARSTPPAVPPLDAFSHPPPQHGLEALSAAASSEPYHLSKSTSHHSSSLPDGTPRPNSDTHRTSGSPQTQTNSRLSSHPTPTNLTHILNPPPSSIPPGVWEPILSRSADLSQDMESTTDHEVAFLLRHFSESPGQWMDLFDLQAYFSYYVPVKAMTNPLLKNAACAFAAKQLGRVNGRRPAMGGCSTTLGASELYPDIRSTDWSLKGSHYYDKAIGSLRDALKDGTVGVGYNSPEEDMQRRTGSLSPDNHATGEKRKAGHNLSRSEELFHSMERRKARRISTGRALSDEMAAATAILCNYELLEGSGTAWLRHLDGTKTLLDVVQGSMMPLQAPWAMPRPPISRARQATFWNFARQDFLSALINETQTRLDTEDLKMWRDAGLLIDDQGFIQPSNTSANGLPEGQSMKEDMISNALIWIMAKIVNYAVAADTGPSPGRESWEGINQATLYQTWTELHKHLAIWYGGLPDTFRPCAHLSPHELSGKVRNGAVFPEIWYNIPLCASTMQWYHMSRMLLLLNQPQQSTMGKTTFFRRFGSYKTITTDIEHHGRAICSIAACRPDASVRIHSVQPLFTAGQCLELPEERSEIIRLLKEIQDDTGWATDYRVKQLLAVWNWPESIGM